MKGRILFFVSIAFFVLGMVGCHKDDSVIVSSQDLRFGLAAETQTFVVNANCKWTITKNDDADWYQRKLSKRKKDEPIFITN